MAKQDPVQPPEKGARRTKASTRPLPTVFLSRTAKDTHAASEALLVAAAELFATQSPSKVKLRDIAERAGVNYGLIHRHFGTRDDLLRELFRRVTHYGALLIHKSADVDEATERLFNSSAGGFADLFALVALDGADPQSVVGDTSTVDAYTELIKQRWSSDPADPHEPFDPRLVAGFVMINMMMWDLVGPYAKTFSGIDEQTLEELRPEMLRLLQTIINVLAPPR
jgi:AcrR family transcriptional regulator